MITETCPKCGHELPSQRIRQSLASGVRTVDGIGKESGKKLSGFHLEGTVTYDRRFDVAITSRWHSGNGIYLNHTACPCLWACLCYSVRALRRMERTVTHDYR